jgi:hypothetical protein
VKFVYLSKICTVVFSEEMHEINTAKDVKNGLRSLRLAMEVSPSELIMETAYTGYGFSWYSSAIPNKLLYSTLY